MGWNDRKVKWGREKVGKAKRRERKDKVGEDRTINLCLLFLEKILFKKINATCSKSKIRKGLVSITSPYCQRNSTEQQNKIRLSCHSELLCTSLRRSRNRPSHGGIANPSGTFFFKDVFIKAPINSQEFSHSNGPGFSLLELGISEVVLSSLVLRVGLPTSQGISKAAETGGVPQVQVRKDRSVKIILAEEWEAKRRARKHCEEGSGLRGTFGKWEFKNPLPFYPAECNIFPSARSTQ